MERRISTAPLKILGNERGQSTVEFALTLVLLMAFILFFIQVSLLFAWGNYIHYATFMSARAYLAAGPDLSDQQERARNVIIRMLKRGPAQPGVDRLPFVAMGVDGENPPGLYITPPPQFEPFTRNLSWMEGVRYRFKSRVFALPLAGSRDGSVNSVTLQSESWLGREPTYVECLNSMPEGGVIDNGC